MRGSDTKVRLETLLRRLQHGSIFGDMNWIPIKWEAPNATPPTNGTKFPPADRFGVLQSSGSVGLRLRMDRTEVDFGGRPTTRQREAAEDATGADGAASGAPVAAPAGMRSNAGQGTLPKSRSTRIKHKISNYGGNRPI